MARVLIAFHSSAGTTRKVAQALAAELSADLEEIREVNPIPVDIKAKGLGNFRNMGRVVFTALRGRTVPIKLPEHDAAQYDLVVVGTPVYAGSLPGPTRAYLTANSAKFRAVAFFACGADSAPQNRVLGQMQQVCGQAPKAVASFQAEKVLAGDWAPLKEFASKLSSS